jgi:hypothetical protein
MELIFGLVVSFDNIEGRARGLIGSEADMMTVDTSK